MQWQEMVPTFLSAAWSGESFHRLGVQDTESLILVDALFLLDGGKRSEGKKKTCHGCVGFPWSWTPIAGYVTGSSY
jgi:hypothetical protein